MMKLLGVKQIITTNVAGAVNKDYKVTFIVYIFVSTQFLLRLVTLSF